MDNKTINKSEQTQREYLDERKKDRGDNFKKQDVMKKVNDGINLKARKLLPNQGDVPVINKVTKIPKPMNNINKIDKLNNDKTRKPNEIKPKLTTEAKVDAGAENKSINKTSEMNAAVNKIKAKESIVSDRVCLRPKPMNNQGKDTKNAMKSDLKTDKLKNQQSLETTQKGNTSDLSKLDNNKMNSDEKKEKDTTQRKPMIKTVKSKNDNRVYKAVTFTEQKRIKPTILEINIPNIQAKKKTKLVDKNLEVKPASLQGASNKSTSKLNIKSTAQYSRRNRLTERIKRKKLNRCISSPDKFKKVDSPPTEVAKWAPSCLNAHTKPYYEAWVDTTLAAISKLSKKDKLFFEKQNIITSFQKSLELGTESPDLVHESFTDECYTGKIKIKRKNLSKKSRQPLITPLIDLNT